MQVRACLKYEFLEDRLGLMGKRKLRVIKKNYNQNHQTSSLFRYLLHGLGSEILKRAARLVDFILWIHVIVG